MKTILPFNTSIFCYKARFILSSLKINLIAFSAILFFSQTLSAKSVPPSVAAKVAKHFYQSTAKNASFAKNVQLSPVHGTYESSVPTNAELLHIFNVNNSNGFIIVAGDDAIQPILGYSEKGSFDPENLPDNFAKWLEDYQNEIIFAINNELKATSLIKDQWKALKKGMITFEKNGAGVLPLLTTTWNQSPYYNEYCPGGSVTGCVATAMAQVLNYWEFPVRGSGFHWYLENDYGVLWANYNSSYYKWWEMPDNLTGPNESVANLMYQCGVSVNMNYSPSSSGAYPGLIPGALETYFGYDPNMQLVYKGNYTNASWNSLMVAELDAARPILYGGHSSSAGHRFVCDGYLPYLLDNELFHINWGWGGAYDGYFTLSYLTPDGTGIGGGTPDSIGYNASQSAVIGVQPDPLGPPSLEMLAPPEVFDTNFIYTDDYLIIGQVRNTGVTTFNGKIAAALFERENDSFVAFMDSSDVSIFGFGGIGIGTYSNQTTVLPGFYYVSFLYKAENSDNWIQIENTFATNRTDMVILDFSSGLDMISLIEQPVISTNLVVQNIPFTITAKLGNLLVAPSWSGEVAAELYSMDFNYLSTIEVKQNITINNLNIDFPITFSSSGLDVPPGAYRIAMRGKSNNGTVWTLPLSLPGVASNTIINVLAPPIPADAYEDNNTISSAYPLGLSFTNDNASVNTQGANMHTPEDYDFYKIDLPAGFDYQITPRVHDSYNASNGQSYSNDVRFLYAINDEPFSESFDDVPFPQSFNVQGGNTIHFRVNPYFLGTLGTYLLDINLHRTPSTGVNTLLVEEIFRVYPNPASAYIMVELLQPNSEAKTMNLYNMNGQLVFSDRFNSGLENRIPTENFPNGLYILNVVTETSISSKKVSINH